MLNALAKRLLRRGDISRAGAYLSKLDEKNFSLEASTTSMLISLFRGRIISTMQSPCLKSIVSSMKPTNECWRKNEFSFHRCWHLYVTCKFVGVIVSVSCSNFLTVSPVSFVWRNSLQKCYPVSALWHHVHHLKLSYSVSDSQLYLEGETTYRLMVISQYSLLIVLYFVRGPTT